MIHVVHVMLEACQYAGRNNLQSTYHFRIKCSHRLCWILMRFKKIIQLSNSVHRWEIDAFDLYRFVFFVSMFRVPHFKLIEMGHIFKSLAIFVLWTRIKIEQLLCDFFKVLSVQGNSHYYVCNEICHNFIIAFHFATVFGCRWIFFF